MKLDQEIEILPWYFISYCVLASHHTSVAPSSLKEVSWIFVSSSWRFWILQYISNWWTQLSSFSAFNSPLYIGSSNLLSSFNRGVLSIPFEVCWCVWVMVVLVEEDEDSCEDEDEDDCGDGGGLPPFPLPPPPQEPSPFGGLELSSCSLVFLSS